MTLPTAQQISETAKIIARHRLFKQFAHDEPSRLCQCGRTFSTDSEHDVHVANVIEENRSL